MSWDTRRITDLLRRLLSLYYRRTYGTLARRVGQPGVSAGGGRGFIIVQIDGLAYKHLLYAMEVGAMPYMRRLVREDRLVVSPWRCGLPSTTPAVQAAIMFGSRYDIPGFRWYDKRNRLPIVAKRPDQMRALQMRLRNGQRGILRGGSSYVNLFDGDADLAFFTLSAIHPQKFFESVRGMGLVLLFMLSPIRSLRVAGLTVWNYIRGLLWRVLALFRRTVVRPYDVIGPLLASAVNALFTEVQTFGVLLDIYRRVPAIYTNYNTYDEAAHLWGATHPMALAALRDIDRRIHQIDRMRRRYPARAYDLYILSDHGNTPSIPFSRRTGKGLARFIAEELGDGNAEELGDGNLLEDVLVGLPGYSAAKARYLLEELEVLGERLPPGLRRVVNALHSYVGQRIPSDPEAEGVEGYDLGRRDDVVVRVSGPLAHVYFNVASRPLDLIEVAVLYPQLLDRLLECEGVGLIAGRAGDQIVALGADGGSAIASDGRVRVESPDPLEPYGERDWVARELARVLSFPHSGDMLLLGKLEADGRMVTFEEQIATHGGLGGPQDEPFIATPPDVELTPSDSPERLYCLFRSRYKGR